MSSDIFHELNPVLVAQVDAFAEMLEQRNLARDAAICLEQELAAANRLIANALTWLDRADSKGYFTLGMANILDALTGKTDIDASCGGTGPLTERQVRDVLAEDRTHYWPGGES